MFDHKNNRQNLTPPIPPQPQLYIPQHIPIVVTKHQTDHHRQFLKVSPQALIDRRVFMKSKEQRKRGISSHQHPRNQSMEGEIQTGQVTRTRRISSSTASKHFPKGFFAMERRPRRSQPKKMS